MKNKLSTLLLAFLPVLPFAQIFYEIDAHYGLGASELSYNSVPGFAISIYPVKNFGFSTGVEYSWRWNTKTSKPSGTGPAVVDGEGDSLVFKYSIDKYKEELFGRILQVPLLLKYNNDSYYTAAGVKIGMVQEASAKISYKGLKTEGYYPQYDLSLTGPLFQGFGEQKDSSLKTKISSKTLAMLALEGGVKLRLSDRFTLLAGVFADYSFNKGFNRSLQSVIERVEVNRDSANLVANSTWNSWNPWSVGAVVKLSFSSETKSKELSTLNSEPSTPPPPQPPPDTSHNITVIADVPPPPVPILPEPPLDTNACQPPGSQFQTKLLPSFLLNREADFVFNYPEARTSPNDSLHKIFVSQMAEILRANPKMQLHCIGYSEKLLSESVAYETAFQRSLRIRYTLTRFYGIEENRIFIYSQGSKNQGYRRAECHLFSTLP